MAVIRTTSTATNITIQRTREIRKLNFMTDQGSTRDITRLALRAEVAGRLFTDSWPRDSLDVPRCLPARRAAPMPPATAAPLPNVARCSLAAVPGPLNARVAGSLADVPADANGSAAGYGSAAGEL